MNPRLMTGTQNKIYLDFNATSPLSKRAQEKFGEVLSVYGNPSSIHWAGQSAKKLVREARQKIAQFLNVSPLELIFTSGGSESNTTVLQTFFQLCQKLERNEFITTNIEHPSVLKTLQRLQDLGAVVHTVNVGRNGQLDWDHFAKVLGAKTALVSMMLANNETGLILPIQKISSMAHQAGAKVHVDAVQGLGKMKIDLRELDVDYASFSGHKFYSFKGSGMIYAKKGNDIRPLICGSQERQRRGGTENLLGIWSLGLACEDSSLLEPAIEKMEVLRDYFEAQILKQIPDIQITHQKSLRLPNTSSVLIKDVDGETLLMSLDVKGFAVSTGAACSSGNPEPSPNLLALGMTRAEAQSSLRVSFGWSTSLQEVKEFLEALKSTVTRLRTLDRLDGEVRL
jgi:cysteine desulfurase